jgi:hypothetical protein
MERYGKLGWNLYFAVNAADPAVRTTPRKEQLTALRALHLDIDLPKRTPPSAEAFAALRARLTGAAPPPTVPLFSAYNPAAPQPPAAGGCGAHGGGALWRRQLPQRQPADAPAGHP